MPQSLFDAGFQNCENAVNKRVWIVSSAAVLLLAGIALYAYQRWGGDESTARQLMEDDPAIASGIASGELRPFRVSLLRGREAG